MNNTAVVEVTRITPHPLYRKLLKKSKKYKVETNGQKLVAGQMVKIIETRPIAKDKHFAIYAGKKATEAVEVKKAVKTKKEEAKV